MSVWHRHPGVRSGNELSFGERAADKMRNVMGSWPFVFGFLAIMFLWGASNTLLLANILHHKQFDPYPYVFLNLFLSMLAGLQGAILLIAAKRADSIASEQAIHHLHISEELSEMVKQNTEIISEIRDHLKKPQPRQDVW